MPFTEKDYRDLVDLLTEHPEWRTELRSMLFGEEPKQPAVAPFFESTMDRVEAVLERLAEAQARAEGRFDRVEAAIERLAEAQARTEQRVEELAQAQARTEQRIEELAQAQAKTEQRMDRVEAALERLAEAQARTEERLNRVEAAVERLAEAQARTEERLNRVEAAVERLAEAQARTEERLNRVEAAVERLAEAQARTEIAIEKLSRQVGGLSETVGGDIEDIAYIVLHDVLQREFGWKVQPLQRSWQTWDTEPEEVNVFGQATDPNRPETMIWIIGEAKHNLTMKEVVRFENLVKRARQHLRGEIFPVCFCYRARPEVQEKIKESSIRLLFSYGKLV